MTCARFERRPSTTPTCFPTPGSRLNGSDASSVEDFAAAGVQDKNGDRRGVLFPPLGWRAGRVRPRPFSNSRHRTGQYGPGYTDLYDGIHQQMASCAIGTMP